jgi:hypothetical protein
VSLCSLCQGLGDERWFEDERPEEDISIGERIAFLRSSVKKHSALPNDIDSALYHRSFPKALMSKPRKGPKLKGAYSVQWGVGWKQFAECYF